MPDDPSVSGYYYYENKAVMRVVRHYGGKVMVTCYRHRQCKLFLGVGRDPGNYELKRWLWEVPPTPDGAGSAQNKELAEQHKAIARRRWGAK